LIKSYKDTSFSKFLWASTPAEGNDQPSSLRTAVPLIVTMEASQSTIEHMSVTSFLGSLPPLSQVAAVALSIATSSRLIDCDWVVTVCVSWLDQRQKIRKIRGRVVFGQNLRMGRGLSCSPSRFAHVCSHNHLFRTDQLFLTSQFGGCMYSLRPEMYVILEFLGQIMVV